MRPRSGVRARFIVGLILAAVLAAGAARAEIFSATCKRCREQAHLHRHGPQGRQSEQGGAGLVHAERRPQLDHDPDRGQELEGQADLCRTVFQGAGWLQLTPERKRSKTR